MKLSSVDFANRSSFEANPLSPIRRKVLAQIVRNPSSSASGGKKKKERESDQVGHPSPSRDELDRSPSHPARRANPKRSAVRGAGLPRSPVTLAFST